MQSFMPESEKYLEIAKRERPHLRRSCYLRQETNSPSRLRSLLSSVFTSSMVSFSTVSIGKDIWSYIEMVDADKSAFTDIFIQAAVTVQRIGELYATDGFMKKCP